NGPGVGGDRRGRKEDRLCIEQRNVEAVGGPKRPKQGFERLKASFELVPLHGKRSIEQRDERSRPSCLRRIRSDSLRGAASCPRRLSVSPARGWRPMRLSIDCTEQR